jgi:hypothetical protein
VPHLQRFVIRRREHLLAVRRHRTVWKNTCTPESSGEDLAEAIGKHSTYSTKAARKETAASRLLTPPLRVSPARLAPPTPENARSRRHLRR